MLALSRICRQITRSVLLLAVVTLAVTMAFFMPTLVNAQTDPGLGTSASFAVLGGSAVTNTGSSVLNGDLGVAPLTAITGFPPGVLNGTLHTADAVALQAQSDVTAAYNSLAGQLPCTDLTGQDLGGLTLISGIYCFAASAQLTGNLTLDAAGNSAAVFVFQIGSTLTTASNSSVQVINSGTGCNIYWQVGSSATLGTTTAFQGNILALTDITLNTGAIVSPGRVLARNGAVTLDTNTVSATACIAPLPTATATATTAPTATPIPTALPTATTIPAASDPGSGGGAAAAATFPPLPTFTPSPTMTAVGSLQGVQSLPNTGGGRPQATYWLHQQGR